MGYFEERVVEGGLEAFDQYQARALDMIRESQAIFIVCGPVGGAIQSIAMLPRPQTLQQQLWNKIFLDTVEAGLNLARQEQDAYELHDHDQGEEDQAD